MADEVFPIIDLSQGNNWPDTKGPEIVEACKKWGFMILTGHGIPKHIIDSMFEMHQDFCMLPEEKKLECVIDERQIGYDLKRSKIGMNECMVFGGVKGDIVQGDNIHPWWDAEKRAKVEEFKGMAHNLGLELLKVFATSFGLDPEYFTSAHDTNQGPGSVLRMLHYPKLGEKPKEDFPRLYSHTDWGSLTLVWPRSGGLEVETPSKRWLEVPLIPDSIVVNVGDAMSLWSGQALKSTLHKISFDNLPIDQTRWSMAYFVNANTRWDRPNKREIDAKLEILKREEDGRLTLSSDQDTVLTAGEYHQARLYMSQKEDAKNNWVGQSDLFILNTAHKLASVVERLGVANGSGLALPI
ncbi:unnamed protein product [Clonostachys rosea f. rosea IK726]|uniref:Uncharacterized protein n=1 Tax=Clonostachys rosea f. rosea IK726 TaxID=1349383 RepID=A0ACA9UU76_BIOOC|nr:unnamed protein product [Clonostachys rosea f. rosea IK726]